MPRNATPRIDEMDETSVMISKELFDSTIGFIRSDVVDVKAEVRELRSRQQAHGEKLDAFRDKLDELGVRLERKMDEKLAAADKKMDERLAGFEKGADGKFDRVDGRFKRIEEQLEALTAGLARNSESLASVISWQKAMMVFPTLLLAIGGGLFTAMGRGFHWF
jgi:chromosome segregation ATPase